MQLFYSLLLILFAPIFVFGQSAGQYTTKEGLLPYRLVEPALIEEGKQYPILVFFHGAGERGTDNEAQLTHINKAFDRIQAEQNCFILLPQCPKGQRWVDADWSAKAHDMKQEPTPWLQGSMNILDSLLQELPIDSQRVYAMGLSMGGFATWEAIARWPSHFAAAVPICGGGDPAQANTIGTLPIWAFHGLEDPVVRPGRTIEMIKALRAIHNTAARRTLYPSVGHGAWGPALKEPDLFPWLFRQKR